MKFCTLVFANLLASAAYAKECKYCYVKPDSLPTEMIDTLKEIASQQASQEILESSNVFFEPDDDQDAKDIVRKIGATLSAFDISSKILPTDATDEHFIITLPKVSLESLTYGVFELPNHLKKGFGLLAAEPDFLIPRSQEDEIRPFGSSGGNADNVCFDGANKDWHLHAMKVPQAWQYSMNQGKPSKGEGIIIGQMDSGYSDHTCFSEAGGFYEDSSNKGFNAFIGEDSDDPRDTLTITISSHALVSAAGHGTLVGSAAVSSGDLEMETEGQSSSVPSIWPSNCCSSSTECGSDERFQSDYRGVIAETESGLECQRWDSQKPHGHSITAETFPDKGLEENYCRNPDNSPSGAWCYTTDPNPKKRWQYCNVPMCNECGSEERFQSDYRGMIAETGSGLECQRWDSQKPHGHSITAETFPDKGLEENYCRNPDNSPSGAWCYTTDPNPKNKWQNCNVPVCPKLAPKGTAPSAKLLTIRTVNSPLLSEKDVERLTRAYDTIVDEDIDVHIISMSLGNIRMERSRRDKLSLAMCRAQIDKHLITIVAGGQSVRFKPFFADVMFPARFEHAIAIGGYEVMSGSGPMENRKRRYYKIGHYGSGIDVTGPAKTVCTSRVKVKDGRPIYSYKSAQGTSIATALAGGVAALWLAHHGRQELIDLFEPYTLNQAFQMALRMSATKEGWHRHNLAPWLPKDHYYEDYGSGMIDAVGLLKLAPSSIKNRLESSDAKTGYDVCKTEDSRTMLRAYGLQETVLASFSDEDLDDHFLELEIYAKTNQVIAAQTDPSSPMFARTIFRVESEVDKPATLSSALRSRLESSTVNKTTGDEL